MNGHNDIAGVRATFEPPPVHRRRPDTCRLCGDPLPPGRTAFCNNRHRRAHEALRREIRASCLAVLNQALSPKRVNRLADRALEAAHVRARLLEELACRSSQTAIGAFVFGYPAAAWGCL